VILEVCAYSYTLIEFLHRSTVHYFCFNIGSTILHFLQRRRLLKPSLHVPRHKRDTTSFTCQLLTKLSNDRQTQKSKQVFAHSSVRINEQFLFLTKRKIFTNTMFLTGQAFQKVRSCIQHSHECLSVTFRRCAVSTTEDVSQLCVQSM
jgi:hypothetical protein